MVKKYITEDAIEFLKESNNIENEWDDDSLAQALYSWNFLINEKKLTRGVILKTHKILMLHHLVGIEKGYFRACVVYIGGREGLRWPFIPAAIDEWLGKVKDTIYFSKTRKDFDTMKEVMRLHVEYERIHPFVDGNGRTGRMFMNWIFLQCGFPIMIIREAEKQNYYKWFDKGESQ